MKLRGKVLATKRRRYVDDLDRTFGRIERLTAVGSTIGALEQLATHKTLDDKGLLSWPVNRTRLVGAHKFHIKQLDKVLAYPGVIGLVQTRLLSGAGLLAPGGTRRSRAACLAGLAGTGAAMNVRSNYGLDGSDQLAFINYAVALLEKLFPDDRKAREFALSFIAAQSCLSYFTSGVVKMTSPVWRNGAAMPGIFRTRTYGDKFLFGLLRDRETFAKLMAWGVMVAEATFPLVLVVPKPVARLFFLSGMAFHVGNAKFMGLNRFFWSFVATYPAVEYFARSSGKRA
ncbi:hypothetical protein [Amycolatopsis minnesotensis]|uniref:HTTM-like domain-containing protein n=1 Tax=Amycolatopsis minnesotensis TaxID=337894 RepID=A0ABN2RQT4_9PSEU